MLSLNSLTSTPHKKKKRLGRGNASGTGTTAGRGTKGQRARNGSAGGLKLRGLKAILKSVPKVKGFTSQYAKYPIMNLTQLDNNYATGAVVHADKYKILGQGAITKPLTVYAASFSKAAQTKLEQAGGKTITCGKQS